MNNDQKFARIGVAAILALALIVISAASAFAGGQSTRMSDEAVADRVERAVNRAVDERSAEAARDQHAAVTRAISATRKIERARARRELRHARSQAREAGYESGQADGYANGSAAGYSSGHSDGYSEGEVEGYEDGEADGYEDGNLDGYLEGYDDGSYSGW